MKKSGFVITITDLFLSANHRRKKCVVPKNIAFFCVDLHGQELEIERACRVVHQYNSGLRYNIVYLRWTDGQSQAEETA